MAVQVRAVVVKVAEGAVRVVVAVGGGSWDYYGHTGSIQCKIIYR